MSAIVEPISPSKALIMDTMMDENNQQENMKMQVIMVMFVLTYVYLN